MGSGRYRFVEVSRIAFRRFLLTYAHIALRHPELVSGSSAMPVLVSLAGFKSGNLIATFCVMKEFRRFWSILISAYKQNRYHRSCVIMPYKSTLQSHGSWILNLNQFYFTHMCQAWIVCVHVICGLNMKDLFVNILHVHVMHSQGKCQWSATYSFGVCHILLKRLFLA